MKKMLIFFIFLCGYFLRLYFSQSLFIKEENWLKLVGSITREPYLFGSYQIIYLDNFMIQTDIQPRYHYGQSIEVVGKVTKRVTRYHRIYFSMENPAIRLLNPPNTWLGQSTWLTRLNHWSLDLLCRLLPAPHAGLLGGILLGSKEALPVEFTQNLQKTGTIHLAVASGYNISVVLACTLAVVLRYLKRPFAIVFSFFGLLFYLFLAGAQPPLVRAAIMATLALVAQVLGRDQASLRGLMLTAGIMLMISPALIFDLGFQLSVAATAGILLIKFPHVPETLGVTLSAQVLTLPLLFFSFGQFNLLSPVINFLLLPMVPLVMSLGAILLVVGWVPILGPLVAFLVYIPLEYMTWLITLFSRINVTLVKI